MKVVNVQIIIPDFIEMPVEIIIPDFIEKPENEIIEQFIGDILSTCKPLEEFIIGEIVEEQNEAVLNKAKRLCDE